MLEKCGRSLTPQTLHGKPAGQSISYDVIKKRLIQVFIKR